jgi:hypothetical protein
MCAQCRTPDVPCIDSGALENGPLTIGSVPPP